MSKPKIKNIKSKEQRETEVKKIMDQLQDFGFPDEILQEFIKICTLYTEHTQGSSGKIPLKGYQRLLDYKLSVQPHIESTVVLKYDQHV